MEAIEAIEAIDAIEAIEDFRLRIIVRVPVATRKNVRFVGSSWKDTCYAISVSCEHRTARA